MKPKKKEMVFQPIRKVYYAKEIKAVAYSMAKESIPPRAISGRLGVPLKTVHKWVKHVRRKILDENRVSRYGKEGIECADRYIKSNGKSHFQEWLEEQRK